MSRYTDALRDHFDGRTPYDYLDPVATKVCAVAQLVSNNIDTLGLDNIEDRALWIALQRFRSRQLAGELAATEADIIDRFGEVGRMKIEEAQAAVEESGKAMSGKGFHPQRAYSLGPDTDNVMYVEWQAIRVDDVDLILEGLTEPQSIGGSGCVLAQGPSMGIA